MSSGSVRRPKELEAGGLGLSALVLDSLLAGADAGVQNGGAMEARGECCVQADLARTYGVSRRP